VSSWTYQCPALQKAYLVTDMTSEHANADLAFLEVLDKATEELTKHYL